MAEITSLTEDNERLSEQLASGIERPKGKIHMKKLQGQRLGGTILLNIA